MNVVIIVYSETGNTLDLCKRAQADIEARGHRVTLKRITVNDVKTDRTLTAVPSAKGYDYVVIGTPVQAFSIPGPVAACLARIDIAENQKLGILVTQFFHCDCFGGTRTVKMAFDALARFHPVLVGSGIVHVRSRKKTAQIDAAIRNVADFEGKA